jgi:hypothetical protein
MSRSVRKQPFVGRCGSDSDKRDKLIAHRRERRCVRQLLIVDPDCETLPHKKNFGDIESFSKDGKMNIDRFLLPDDPELFQKRMRK